MNCCDFDNHAPFYYFSLDFVFLVIAVFGATVLVDRPPGVFEFENFAKGTKSMMDAIVEATAAGTTTIIGQLMKLSCIS